MRREWIGWAGLALVAVAAAAAPVGAETLFAVTQTNALLRFDSASPGAILSTTPITGLVSGETVQGIDFWPATGELFALGIVIGSSCDMTLVNGCGRLYRLDPATGAATRVGPGPFSTTLSGSTIFYGFTFSPVTSTIRVVNAAGQNFRLNPNTGTILGPDNPLNPGGFVVVGAAHDRSFAGAPATTLFGIDAGVDRLVRQGGVNGTPSADGGTLTPIGSLGFATDGNVGFDISAATGIAYAALLVGQARLFTIDLATGAATLVGIIGNGATVIRALAVAPPKNVLITGAGAGGGPHVRVFDASGVARFELFPFDPAFTGGVRVALCDVNGDGVADVVAAAGPGGGPHVRVFNGVTGVQFPGLIGSFFAFDPAFTGGLHVGCTDLNEDGKGDVIVAVGPGGGPHVRVFSGASGNQLPGPLGSFFAYDGSFLGGVFVGGE